MYYVVSYVENIEVARSKGFKLWRTARQLERKLRGEYGDFLGNVVDNAHGVFTKIVWEE